MDVMLSFACSEGDTVENVIRWAVGEVSEDNRLGFLLGCALDIEYQKKLRNEELMNLLVDHSPFREGQRSRIKKPNIINNKNWDSLTKLALYGDNL